MSWVTDFLSQDSLFGLSRLELLGIYTLPGLSYTSFHILKEYHNRPSQFAKDLLRALGQERSLFDKFLNIIIYTIAVMCIALGWPLFAIWAIFESQKEASLEIKRNKPDFSCAPEYLLARVDPRDVEIASYVIDPLGTVPPLPFGHLNQGWVSFLSEMLEPDDEMWSFYIPRGSLRGKYRFAATGDIRGYARVLNGEILSEFITESD